MAIPQQVPVKVPQMNFRGNKFVNEDGTLTDVAQAFFDSLYTFFIKNISEERLVPPSQNTNNLDVIQDATETSPTGTVVYTCAYGTFAYDTDTNEAKVALDDGTGKPIFKVIQTL